MKFLTRLYFYSYERKCDFLEGSNLREIINPNEELEDILYGYFSREKCEERWKKGIKLYAWIEDNRPVSFAWFSNSREHFVGELSKVLVFERKINCIIDCFTPEEDRKQGYYSNLIKSLALKYSKFPTIIYVLHYNYPSIRGIEKAGFTRYTVFYRIWKLIFKYQTKKTEFEH